MSLRQITEQFTDFCRTGTLDPALKVDPKRAQLYFKMVNETIAQTLKNIFPLTFHALGSTEWDALVSRFVKTCDLPSPFLWKIAQTFVEFMRPTPYLNDLTHFEWIEVEVYRMPDIPWQRSDKQLTLNPESRLVRYSYPVFKKNPLSFPYKQEGYPLFVFRHPVDREVRFIALSPFFEKVLRTLPQTGEPAVEKFLSDMRAQCAIG